MRIWVTEYGYQTNPPDALFGVSWAQQARYLRRAYAKLQRNARVDMFIWFLLRDETRPGGWESGLLTADWRAKTAYRGVRGARVAGPGGRASSVQRNLTSPSGRPRPARRGSSPRAGAGRAGAPRRCSGGRSLRARARSRGLRRRGRDGTCCSTRRTAQPDSTREVDARSAAGLDDDRTPVRATAHRAAAERGWRASARPTASICCSRRTGDPRGGHATPRAWGSCEYAISSSSCSPW